MTIIFSFIFSHKNTQQIKNYMFPPENVSPITICSDQMPDVSAFLDTVWFTAITVCSIGGICGLIAAGIAVLCNLELTPLDTSILVWMIVALCISTVILFSALYLICCDLKTGKLILAGLYTVFDLFILFIAIAILALRPSIVEEIGKAWTDESQSSIVVYLEEQFECCGFNQKPNRDCKERTESCRTAIDDQLEKYSGLIGGILIGAFAVFAVAVVLSYFRALKKPAGTVEDNKTEEIRQFQDKLAPESQFWF
jgi:hypothetical protein